MTNEITVNGVTYRIGDTIKILNMDNNEGKDTQADDYNGRTGEIKFIDDLGTLFGSWGSLGVIPDLDAFVKIQ